MEAKLIKNELPYGYFLYDEKGDLIASTIKGYKKQPLSIKNCEAIANGYDLDELADEFSRKFPNDSEPIRYASFIIGFQKALSILGDKKFSERDVKIAYNRGSYDDRLNNKKLFSDDKYIKSLQQTEWEVSCNPDVKDADGNLILKRKI